MVCQNSIFKRYSLFISEPHSLNFLPLVIALRFYRKMCKYPQEYNLHRHSSGNFTIPSLKRHFELTLPSEQLTRDETLHWILSTPKIISMWLQHAIWGPLGSTLCLNFDFISFLLSHRGNFPGCFSNTTCLLLSWKLCPCLLYLWVSFPASR